jgi:hypothetical protein
MSSGAVVIIINPKNPPKRVNAQGSGAEGVTVLDVDVLENATTAEILHAALSDLEPDPV